MSEHDQGTLFVQPFFQTSDKNSQAMNTNSHGLGLNISYKMAKILGGSLTCSSELGKGSTFTLLLKADACDNPILATENKNRQKVAKLKRRIKPRTETQQKLETIMEDEEKDAIDDTIQGFSASDNTPGQGNLLELDDTNKTHNLSYLQQIIVADDQAINIEAIKGLLSNKGLL